MYVDQNTKITGLIGYPLEHSFSPLMHNAAFQALKLNYVYIPIPVTPGKLRDAIIGFKALNFIGANVTIPHKEEIIPFLDFITEEAKLVGAVNTLFWTDDGYLVGDNTDVEGFHRTLTDYQIKVVDQTVVIVGSGGAARAVAVALARQGAKEILFLARRANSAYQIIKDMENLFPETNWGSHTKTTAMFASDLGRTSLLVNASPVGMYPHIDATPVPKQMLGLLLPESHVYDIVYNPSETKLIKLAKETGENLKTHTGIDMLVNQGAVSFERWTGKVPPSTVMTSTIKRQISFMQGSSNKPEGVDIYAHQEERTFEEAFSDKLGLPQVATASEESPPAEIPKSPPKGKHFDTTI